MLAVNIKGKRHRFYSKPNFFFSSCRISVSSLFLWSSALSVIWGHAHRLRQKEFDFSVRGVSDVSGKQLPKDLNINTHIAGM